MSDLAFKATFAATLFAIVQRSLGLVSLVVKGHDEALAFLVWKLGFELVEDRFVPEQNKRWVVVAPRGSRGAPLLLARASSPQQDQRIGDQTGGRVFHFLYTATTSGATTNGSRRRASSSSGLRRNSHMEPWRSSRT